MTQDEFYNNLYLAHHGIKGQKWGVRRYLDKNGHLTAEGKKRYEDLGDGKYAKKTKFYEKEKQDFLKVGMSNIDAAKAANGRRKARVALGVLGAASVASIAGIAMYRHIGSTRDVIVRANQMMQTVHKENALDRLAPGNPFYTAIDKKDMTTYASRVFSHFDSQSKITKFMAGKDIKIASEKSGRDAFKELLNDKSFKQYVEKIPGVIGRNMDLTKDKDIKKAYRKFNYDLVKKGKDPIQDKMHDTFYNALKSKGYGGVIDIEDSVIEKWTYKPTILFDNNTKHIISTTPANSEQLSTHSKTFKKAIKYAKIRHTLMSNSTYAKIGGVYLAGLWSFKSSGRQKKIKAFEAQYRKDHPKSKLVSWEIAEIYEEHYGKKSSHK